MSRAFYTQGEKRLTRWWCRRNWTLSTVTAAIVKNHIFTLLHFWQLGKCCTFFWFAVASWYSFFFFFFWKTLYPTNEAPLPPSNDVNERAHYVHYKNVFLFMTDNFFRIFSFFFTSLAARNPKKTEMHKKFANTKPNSTNFLTIVEISIIPRARFKGLISALLHTIFQDI